MERFLLVGGCSVALMGAALIPPVVVARLESGELTTLGIGIVSVGCSLIVCGMMATSLGFLRRNDSRLPSGVRMAIMANILFLAFLALELSDRLVRQDGKIFYWTTFLLVPTLLLFCGVLAARRWAWWITRSVAAFGVLWFILFVALIPFVQLQTDGVPVPWYGRVYMACVSLALAGILALAFWSLGRSDTRKYFGLTGTQQPPNQAVNPSGG